MGRMTAQIYIIMFEDFEYQFIFEDGMRKRTKNMETHPYNQVK